MQAPAMESVVGAGTPTVHPCQAGLVRKKHKTTRQPAHSYRHTPSEKMSPGSLFWSALEASKRIQQPAHSYKHTPSEKMSLVSSWHSLRATSGAMKPAVPACGEQQGGPVGGDCVACMRCSRQLRPLTPGQLQLVAGEEAFCAWTHATEQLCTTALPPTACTTTAHWNKTHLQAHAGAGAQVACHSQVCHLEQPSRGQ